MFGDAGDWTMNADVLLKQSPLKSITLSRRKVEFGLEFTFKWIE